MMKIRTALAFGLCCIALAACGSKRQLVRPADDPSPVAPYAARVAPGSDALVTPDDQARPGRSDEALRRSEKREPDRFDLPPSQ